MAAGTAAQFAASGLTVDVSDNSTESFYGVSIDGGGDRSACSSDPVVYVEDSTAPHVQITSGPGIKTRKRNVQFTFVDTTGVAGRVLMRGGEVPELEEIVVRAAERARRLGL